MITRDYKEYKTMSINILMPALSPTMKDGNLVKWLKNDGDQVKIGDIIAEIETDKAAMEVESVDEGILKILIPAGSKQVHVNTLIAVLLEAGESYNEISTSNVISIATNEHKVGVQHIAQSNTTNQNTTSINRSYFASPLAERLMSEHQINPELIKATGPNNRIVKDDVEKYIATHATVVDNIVEHIHTEPPQLKATEQAIAKNDTNNIKPSVNTRDSVVPQSLSLQSRENTIIPHSNMRRVIAARLQEAKQLIPHFYLTVECNIDSLLQLRAEINSQLGARFSVNDYIIKASALALKQIPSVNASWSDDGIILYGTIDVSVAVALDGGLITPIIKNADIKSIKQISEEIRDLARRAKDGKLAPNEYQGGGFTISNLGMYGIKEFCAIINPPQSAILAIGTSQQKPIVVSDKIQISNIMNVTLSCDHRVIDGVLGAQYLAKFTKFIENPYTMLI